ncbi:Tudor domain-containing protein 1 [Aphanomyces cochlioides]|nr:Tudor domain-containing protein 1 [Aphanomyces cochlioides]
MTIEATPFESYSDDQLASFKQRDGKLHLFNHFKCPFGHRALWTAVESSAPFELINVDLGNVPPAYMDNFNRYGTAPFLLSNGFPIYESAIIAQYLDAKFGHDDLFLRDRPEEATLAQLAAAKFESGPFYRMLRTGSEESAADLKEMLDEVEKIYREHAAEYRSLGPYLLGDKLSSAEILTVPFLFRFEILLKHYRNHDLLDGYPLLTAVLKAAKVRPAFQDTIREPQFYIDAFASYVD